MALGQPEIELVIPVLSWNQSVPVDQHIYTIPVFVLDRGAGVFEQFPVTIQRCPFIGNIIKPRTMTYK
jgi:hypothetical protein